MCVCVCVHAYICIYQMYVKITDIYKCIYLNTALKCEYIFK